MSDLQGKNALLTGATHGIGPVLAKALASEGVNLLIQDLRAEDLHDLAGDLAAAGHRVEAVAANVNEESDRRNLPRRAENALGPIDVLINNTGVEEIIHFERQDPDAIRGIVETNVLSPVLITREMLPVMLERRSGHVVNVSSLAGFLGLPYGAVYSASRAALIQWSLSLNAEIEGSGVHVSVVCPGLITDTGILANARHAAPILLGQNRPQKVARTVVRVLKTHTPEVIVNAMPVRPWIVFRTLAPGLATRLARKLGIMRFLGRLAEDARQRRSET